jgi:hypothetical protein
MKIDMPNRQKWLLGIAGGAVVLFILNQVVISPLSGLWEDHSTEIAHLNTTLAEGRSLIAQGPRLQRDWTDMQAATLPRDPAKSEHDVLEQFETWSRSSGVELGSIKPQMKHGDTDNYSLLECRLDATGSLGSLSQFLFDLEKAPLALRVESVEFLSRDDSGDKLTLSLTITGLRLAPMEGKS